MTTDNRPVGQPQTPEEETEETQNPTGKPAGTVNK